MYKNGIFIREFMKKIWNDIGLTAEDKCVIIYMIEHQRVSIPEMHGNICFLEAHLSYEELSEKCCLSIKSINEVITRLEEHNYLRIVENSHTMENNNVSGIKTKFYLFDPDKLNELGTYERKLNYFESIITDENRGLFYLLYFNAGGYHIIYEGNQNTKLIINCIRIYYMNIINQDYWILEKDNPELLDEFPFNDPEMTKNYKWDYILSKNVLFIEYLPVYLSKDDYYKFWISIKSRVEEKEKITVILSNCTTEEDFISRSCNSYVIRRRLKDEFKETLEQIIRDIWKNLIQVEGYEELVMKMPNKRSDE